MPPRIAVAPTKFSRGVQPRLISAPHDYDILDLEIALKRTYHTDAHAVCYIIETGGSRQPRVNKTGLDVLTYPEPTMQVMMADVDNPDHAGWTDGCFARTIEMLRSIPLLTTTGIYFTTHGYRIVQPLTEAIPVSRVEPVIKQWLIQLSDAGIDVDMACRDWTRHYRLPNVRRDGRDSKPMYMCLEGMVAIASPPVPAVEYEVMSREPGKRRERVTVLDWGLSVPPHWKPRVKAIAKACRQEGENWHALFMSIAGALLERGTAPEYVPAICVAISHATGADSRPQDRETAARSTVDRWADGYHVQGLGGDLGLRKRFPRICYEVMRATAQGQERRAYGDSADGDLPEVDLDDTMRRAHGVVLVEAECGIGKTRAATTVAVERAAKPGKRPPQSMTGITMPTTNLCREVQQRIEGLGGSALRYHGPLSATDSDGNPLCIHHNYAQQLANAGQSVHWECCEGRGMHPCQIYDQCTAREGEDGPSEARIYLGPHQYMRRISDDVGVGGVFFGDEPPPVVRRLDLTAGAIDDTVAALQYFIGDYGKAMRPALAVMRMAVDRESKARRLVSDMCRTYRPMIPREVISDALEGAHLSLGLGRSVREIAAKAVKDGHSPAPPITEHAWHQMRSIPDIRDTVLSASAILSEIRHVVTCDASCAPSGVIQTVDDVRHLVISYMDPDMVYVMERQHPTVMMDAGIGIHEQSYRKAIEHVGSPDLVRAPAKDGAKVIRVMLHTNTATRRRWVPGGKVHLGGGVLRAITRVANVLQGTDFQQIAIITFKKVKESLMAHTGTCEASQWLTRHKDSIMWGHYGAIRGLDHMKDCDVLVTLGDPWPHLPTVDAEADYIGDTLDQRMMAHCRCELEQAHGRLRVVHRTTPCTAIHVGTVRPGGTGWAGVIEVYTDPGGPVAGERCSVDELRQAIDEVGSIRAAAREWGVDHSDLAKMVKGTKPITKKVSDLVNQGVG